jgi:hypothetical protein
LLYVILFVFHIWCRIWPILHSGSNISLKRKGEDPSMYRYSTELNLPKFFFICDLPLPVPVP